LGLQTLGSCREILDVGEKDRELLALGLNGYILLTAEDALVDLRGEIARNLHRKRREKLVGGLELPIHALNRERMAALEHEEAHPSGADQGEIDHQIFEREQVDRYWLADGDFLDAANVADFPALFLALRMRVVTC